MKIAVSDGLPLTVFPALSITDSRIGFAVYAQITADGVDDLTGAAVDMPKTVPAFGFGAPVCRHPSSPVALCLVDRLEIDLRRPEALLPAGTLAPCLNIYVAFDASRGRFPPPYNKFVESYAAKQDGLAHIRARQINVVGQILMPFPDAPPEDCAVRLTASEMGYWCDRTAETIDNGHAAYVAFADSVFPSLAFDGAALAVAPDGRAVATAQLVGADGEPVRKAGVRIFATSAAGYLPMRETETDGQGRVAVPFHALGLESGTRTVIEIGFKWYSNIARCAVEVTT